MKRILRHVGVCCLYVLFALMVIVPPLAAVAVPLTFNAYTIPTTYRQLRTTDFATAEGVISRSDEEAITDKDGKTTYRLHLAYEYEVGGTPYTGARYCYGDPVIRDLLWNRRGELALGTRVTVAYDPTDPAEAVLRPGLTGYHLALIWLLVLLNLGIAVWVYGRTRRRRSEFDPDDPHFVAPTATGWRVRLPGFGRLNRFALTLSVLSGCWAVRGFFAEFDPVSMATLWGLPATVAVAVLPAVWYSPPRLEVDAVACVVRLRVWRTVEVPFSAIREVIATSHFSDPDGPPDYGPFYFCELVLDGVAPNTPPFRLVGYHAEAAAEAFAAWLRAQIAVVSPDGEVSLPGA